MNILYVLKQDPDTTLKTILESQKKDNKITTIDLRTNKNYQELIDLIVSSDKVISW